ncbi:hypothetical protein D083_3387 [Dickeya solani RNS 08.23.3.1.A]|nr:hypothetical protein D083_3387 [Dickeya solani RNS 08.23.3.1.A]
MNGSVYWDTYSAIFAKEDINGPLPNLLFISGDNENRNYFSRMKKIMEEEVFFIF